MRIPQQHSRRSAAAAVECALVMTVLVPLLVGVWEVGRLVNVYQMVMNGAREAGRRAATGEYSKQEIEQIVLDYFNANGLTNLTSVATSEAELEQGGKIYVEINIYDKNGTFVGNDPRLANQMEKIEVTVSVLFNDVEYSPTDLFLPASFQVTATTVWYSLRDIPVEADATIPLE